METINATFDCGAGWSVAGIGVASPWLQKGGCTQWRHFKAKKKKLWPRSSMETINATVVKNAIPAASLSTRIEVAA